jgi:hypothetical protein
MTVFKLLPQPPANFSFSRAVFFLNLKSKVSFFHYYSFCFLPFCCISTSSSHVSLCVLQFSLLLYFLLFNDTIIAFGIKVRSLNCLNVRGPRIDWIFVRTPLLDVAFVQSSPFARGSYTTSVLWLEPNLRSPPPILSKFRLSMTGECNCKKISFLSSAIARDTHNGDREKRSDPTQPDQDQNNRGPGQNLSLNSCQAELVCSVIF